MNVRGRELEFSRTLIMGILNITPDSFSDGGAHYNLGAALTRAMQMKDEGADIIDIGGESTRPGSKRIDASEEAQRIIPVIAAVRKVLPDIFMSVDTYKSEVARQAIEAGADIINDISAGTLDDKMFSVAAVTGAPIILMHMLGEPGTMQADPKYSEKGAVHDVYEFLSSRIKEAVKAGIDPKRIIIDPGIGFGKTLQHNLQLLEAISEFKKLNMPVLIGTSRKAMIGKLLDADTPARLMGTAATVAISVARGADIVRVHDVREIRDVVRVADAMSNKNQKAV